jgi:anti-sigma factor RsiW
MITKDNYEEFFLLYTDNELSGAERHEVERFVADHPELREEWEALLQCRVFPDLHLAFPDRSALLKPETESSNYTDDLLSYIDGELDEINTVRIEAVLRQDPLAENELSLLRQTVSHPDAAIVFPEKDRLYRTEKERRIVQLPWVRAGIAAAIAGAIALILSLPAKHPEAPAAGIVAHRDSPAITHKFIPTVTPAPVAALHPIEAHPMTKQDRTTKQIIQKREPRQQALNQQHVATLNQQHVATLNQQNVATVNPQEVTSTATPKQIDPVKASRETDPVSPVSIGSVPTTGDLAAIVHPAIQTGIPKEQSSFATQALQDEANDQRIGSLITNDPAAAGRTKLRGVFRKVARVFGKTAERDSDGNRQVLVGAFQVSLD